MRMSCFTSYSMIFIFLHVIFTCINDRPCSAISNSTVKNCGRNLKPFMHSNIPVLHRIVGGDYAQHGQFPWIVSLREQDEIGFEHACGATILNENWVITAAHCIIYDSSPEMYEILAGLHKLSKERASTVRRYKISKIIIHPKYDDDSLLHDIALLQVDKPIDIMNSKGYINGICLPSNKEDPTGYATVAGWGHTRQDGVNSDTLRSVLVPIIDREMCNHAYDENPFDEVDDIKETMICAGITGRDSCQNDSGGPLIQTDENGIATLIGIVSNGAGCGLKFYPGIYTKISMYQEWMNTVMS